MSRMVVVAAAAAGYVLGARAGRERFEQIRHGAQNVWSDPRVQRRKAEAHDLARTQGQQAADVSTEGTHRG